MLAHALVEIVRRWQIRKLGKNDVFDLVGTLEAWDRGPSEVADREVIAQLESLLDASELRWSAFRDRASSDYRYGVKTTVVLDVRKGR